MKKVLLLYGLLAMTTVSHGQEAVSKNNVVIKVTLFSESIGMPNFRNFFNKPNLGIRVGTELYYRQETGHQLFQTFNVGFYRHRDLHNGLYISSEFGYRKMFKNFFADVTAGLGYLVVNSALPRYQMSGTEYKPAASTFGRIMPTVGLGAGYKLPAMSIFCRYELFGEMPFGYEGIPALPHKTLHLGATVNLK